MSESKIYRQHITRKMVFQNLSVSLLAPHKVFLIPVLLATPGSTDW